MFITFDEIYTFYKAQYRRVVSVLINTIVVDVSDMMEEELIDARQVVKHGRYHKIARKQVKSKVS
uniref:hypothetical protein n=1 Tax=Bacillus cereus TaxID=1396 RepID=UPI0009AC5B7F